MSIIFLILSGLLSIFAPSQAPASTPQQASGAAPAAFPLGPGDVIEVNVWTGNENLTQQITVAADGTIFVPFYVNKVLNVSGMTSLQVRSVIEQEMRTNYRNPAVQVIQTRIESRKASLAGEVSRPGSYPITGDTTVLDLIIATGGSLSNANLADVQIIRTAKGEQSRVNLLNVLLGIDKTRQKLEPGDLVFVPSVLTVSNKIFFIAEGRSTTMLQVAEKINLLEALARANVVGPNVRLDRVALIRFSLQDRASAIREIKFDETYKSADSSVNVPLENGDLVFLPRGKLGRLNDVLLSVSPMISFIRDTVFLGLVFTGRNP